MISMADENYNSNIPNDDAEKNGGIPEEVLNAMREFFEKLTGGEIDAPLAGRVFFIRGPDGSVETTTDPSAAASYMGAKREDPNVNYVDIPIIGGEWTIRIVDLIPNRGNSEFTFSLEIFPNPDSGMEISKNTIDLYEMMTLITNPSFLNFVLSSLTHANVWRRDEINMVASLNKNDPFIRVIVPCATTVPPKWIRDLDEQSPGDFEITSFTENRITPVGNLDLIYNVTRARHLYEPLIRYDATATINSVSAKNFRNTPLDHVLFYNLLVQELLEDAVRSFYPANEIGAYMLNHLDQLHTFFNVAVSQNSIKFFLDVSPGTIILSDGLPRQYEYLGRYLHGIYNKPYDEKPVKDMKNIHNDRYLIMDQITTFNWTTKTQTYPTLMRLKGTKSAPNDNIIIWEDGRLIFNAGVLVAGFGNKTESNEILYEFKEAPSLHCFKLVKNYWIPLDNDLRFRVSNTEMKPVCIVNVDLPEMLRMELKNSDDIIKHLISMHDNILNLIERSKSNINRREKNAKIITESMVLNGDVFRFMVAFATIDNQ